MKKLLKISVIVFLFFILLISTYLQFKFEKYIIKQKQNYEILSNRKRLDYKPAIFYILFERKKMMKASKLIYINDNVNSFTSIQLYDGYILSCFYKDVEIDNFLEN